MDPDDGLEGPTYEISVWTIPQGEKDNPLPPKADVSFGIVNDWDGDINYDKLTNQGDMYKVMSTVAAIVKQDIARTGARKIQFVPSKRKGSKDRNMNVRTQLYMRYIQSQFPNSKITSAGQNIIVTLLA
jgi:hypothetical protein